MKKRVAILMFFAAVIWGIYYLNPGGRPDRGAEVLGWPRAEVNSTASMELEVQGDLFSLVNRDSSWFVSLPDTQAWPRADADKIQALLEFLSVHKPERELGPYDAAKAQDFGLATPEVTIKVHGIQDWDISIGSGNPTKDGVYALSSVLPGKLLLLDSAFMDQCKKPAGYYYDRRVAVFDPASVVKVELEKKGSPVWKIEKKKRIYQFEFPEKFMDKKVAGQALKFMLYKLSDMKADFLLTMPVDFPAVPYLSLMVDNGTGVQAVDIFKGEEGYVANSTWQTVPFVVDQLQLDELDKSASDLRFRNVMEFNTEKVDLFTLVKDGQALAGVKTPEGWKEKVSKKDIPGIDMSLWRLTNLKFRDEPVAELPKSAVLEVSLRLKDKDGEPVKTLSFYEDPGLGQGLCWLGIAGDSRYYPVSDQVLKDLQGQLPVRD